MPVATSSPAVSHPSGLSKMEDRKRPAISATDEIAPPSKRQAVNGTVKSRDDGESRDEAWIEVRPFVGDSTTSRATVSSTRCIAAVGGFLRSTLLSLRVVLAIKQQAQRV